MSEASSASSSQHVLALALQELPLCSLARVQRVSRLWRAAAADAFASLPCLDLRPHAPQLTDEVLSSLLAKTPGVHALNLSTCTRLTDQGLRPLPAACPALSSLNLSCTHLSGPAVSLVVDSLGSRLQELELAGCSSISEAELVGRFSRFLELDDDEDGLAKVQG